MYEFKRGYDAASRPTFERRDYWDSSNGTLIAGQRDFGDRYYYDPANRLTKVIRGVGYQSTSHSAVESEPNLDYVTRTEYTLDDAGNRKTLLYWDSNGSQSQSVRREDHVFDIENQLSLRYEITFGGGGSTVTRTYTYDANGNQVSSYSPGAVKVDIENRIYEWGNWRYRYDPFGRRIEKCDTGNGTSFWIRYYYDGWQCIEEHVTTRPTTHHRAETSALSRLTDPIWRRVYGPYYVDQILWGEHDPDSDHETTNDKFYFHLDYLYSVVMITSDDGNSPTIEESYRYDEYGQPYFYDGDGTSKGGLRLPAGQALHRPQVGPGDGDLLLQGTLLSAGARRTACTRPNSC